MKNGFVSTIAIAAVAGIGVAAPAAAKSDDSAMNGSCVLGYTKADTDQSGTLSRDEIRQMADTVFNDADADKSGDVTKQEFVDCRNASAGTKSASADRSPENMADADTDKSGDLSREEYMSAADEAGKAARDDQSDQSVTVLRRFIFVPADSKTDPSAMSRDETAASASIGFDALDSNDDGRLSKDEWSAGQATMPDRKADLEKRFGELDKDDSGSLKPQEFEAGAMKAASDALDRDSLDAAVNQSKDTSATSKMSGESSAKGENAASSAQPADESGMPPSNETDTPKAEAEGEPSVVLFRIYPVF